MDLKKKTIKPKHKIDLLTEDSDNKISLFDFYVTIFILFFSSQDKDRSIKLIIRQIL